MKLSIAVAILLGVAPVDAAEAPATTASDYKNSLSPSGLSAYESCKS